MRQQAQESAHLERERTWAAGDDTDLPDLTALPGVAGVGTPPARELVATYVDTADLALTRAGISLSRRRGGADEGWHLATPASARRDDGRDEVHRPLDGDHLAPPEELRRMVESRLHDRDLGPVAEIRTHRSAHDLRAHDGRVLAELADDRVEARALGDGPDPGDGRPLAWRAWGLAVVDDDAALLDAAGDAFARVGAHPSTVSRGCAGALADRLAGQLAVSGRAAAAPPGPTPGRPAREVLLARLAGQAEALLRHDLGMRRHAPTSVHQARVACRRLRGALATYRPLVDRARTDPLRDELRWVARSLAGARDAQVAHELLTHLLEAQPEAHVEEQAQAVLRGPVRARLERTFEDAGRQAREATDALLSSARYLAVLADLERLVADPPWTADAERPAAEVLLPRVRSDWKRLRRRVAAAAGAAPGAGAGPAEDRAYDEALHDARKAAKRLRYACEAVEPVWGRDAKRLRTAAREITQVLGERQDTTVSREHLLAVAHDAERAGETTFTWGRLHGLEEARAAERARMFWQETWPAARKKKRRRWL